MSLHAVVPVKPLGQAKSRLAGALSPAERRALVLEMLSRVLAALRAAPREVAAIWVISADPEVLALAEATGAHPLPDRGGDLNRSLEQARQALVAAGAEAMLALPADVPLITADDIAALSAALAGPAELALAPDAAGQGTNALGMRLPCALPFCFGPDSAARHRRAAAEHGLALYEHRSPTLALDIDDPASLARYRAWPGTAA